MAKVHPHGRLSSTPCYFTSEQETFTIWMKSLVLNGKGCTVFDSNGHIMYRVDNYNSKYRHQVLLMDSRGQVVFNIFRKRSKLFGFWEGYKSDGGKIEMGKPDFQVRKIFNMLKTNSSEREVKLGFDDNKSSQYMIKSWSDKTSCKIVDKFGDSIAEVKRKQTASGVVLGEDVLTMVVKPCIDHSLVMGLVVVNSLINSQM